MTPIEFNDMNSRMITALIQHDVQELDRIDELLSQDSSVQASGLRSLCMGGRERLEGDYTSSATNLQKAVIDFQECGRTDQVAAALNSLSITYAMEGEFVVAIEQATKASQIYEDLRDESNAARTYGNMGAMHQSIGSYPTAIAQYHRALEIYERIGYTSGIATVTGNIGVVHFAMEDYSEALAQFSKALAIHKELNEQPSMARILGNFANALSMLGSFTEALDSYCHALSIYDGLADSIGRGSIVGNYIVALEELGQWEDVRRELPQAERDAASPPSSRIRILIAKARLAFNNNVFDEGEEHLHEALDLAQTKGMPQQQADVHRELAKLARQRSDFDAFLRHEDAVQRINKEVMGSDTRRAIAMEHSQRQIEAERREREKERALLYGALPRSVADRMIRGEKITGDHYEHAAILFADVVGFTTHSSDMHPSDVVALLEQLFASFDALCDQHGVVKVKTIGDSYMCFKADADAAPNAYAVALVALGMNHTSITWPNGDALALRIGIHIGPATAGIIGTQRLQYDVWGDTVNTASRMESTSQAGRIHVSQAFSSLMKDEKYRIQNTEFNDSIGESRNRIRCVERGEIDIKGKGMMSTYWLESA